MKQEIFTETLLQDGSKLEVLQIKPSMLWKASMQFASQKEKVFDIMPFILTQCLSIEGKLISIERIDEMSMGDYNKINEIVSLMLNKSSLF
jgi:hypothetical protein